MKPAKITSARKKKIKTLLSRTNKQNQRFIIIAPPLFQAVQFLPAPGFAESCA